MTLAVLATLAYSGCGELHAARQTLDQLNLLATTTGAPSHQAVSLCRGVVLLAAGESTAARPPLTQAHHAFTAQHDLVSAAAAAIALGACSLAIGEFDEAARQLGEALRQAIRSGCTSLQGLASALRASALLSAGHPEAARALGTAVVTRPDVTPQARALGRYVLRRVYTLAGDSARATQELAIAAAELDEVAASDQEILRALHILEQAELAAAYGEPSEAIDHGEAAREFFAERGMHHEAARAYVALALSYATRRTPADLALAAEALGVVRGLGERHGYGPLLLTAALIEAALANHRGDSQAARALLHRGLAENPHAALGLAGQALRAALATPDGEGWSGHAAVLTRLGLQLRGESAGLIELHSPAGRQLLTHAAARAESARFDLTIDLDRSEIQVGATGQKVSGRPLMCAILAHLLTTCTEGADAERLFREVWKGPEYHPLRHRNTIHVALTRLRQLLRELVPDRELVETTASGWRLTTHSSLCTLRAARS